METDIFNLIGDYGAMGIVFVFFIYQYFKERGKADTLKGTEITKKTDVDEVARKLNEEQQVCLAEVRTTLEFIKLQVSNHLPTAIKEIQEKLDRHIENQNEFEKKILVKIAKF